MKKNLFILVMLGIVAFSSVAGYAHCEIPCGIYGDKMRIDMLKEHVVTIEKSMKLIKKLSDAEDINHNQLVRWINNKEFHANEFQHIVTQYFMTQRVKLVKEGDTEGIKKYNQQLALLHEMLIYSMKAKQSTDLEHTKKLDELIDQFYDIYFTEEQKKHHHKH